MNKQFIYSILFVGALIWALIPFSKGQVTELPPEADSLLFLINKASGDRRAELLYELAQQLRLRSPALALKYAQEGLRLSQTQGDKHREGLFFNLIGTLYGMLGNYDRTLDYLQQSVRVFNQSADTTVYRSHLDLGLTYLYLGQNKQAVASLRQGISLLSRLKKQDNMPLAYSNLGMAMMRQGDFALALRYLDTALIYDAKYPDDAWRLMIYYNMGESEQSLKNYPKALFHYSQSDTLARRLDVPYWKMNVASAKAGLFGAKEDYEVALKEIEQAFQIAQQLGFADETTASVLKRYSELLTLAGKPEEGIIYLQHYITARDSLFKKDLAAKVANLQIIYDVENKEQQLANQQLIIDEQQNRIVLLGLAIALLLLLVFVGYSSYRRRQERRINQALLEEKDKGLQAVIIAQEEERKRIAKDLHDGIVQQLGGIRLALSNLRQKVHQQEPLENTDASLGIITAALDEAVNELREISHQMMPRVIAEAGLLPAIEDLLDKAQRFAGLRCSFEHHHINERLPETIEVGIYRILQELLNNIIKHAGATVVDVQLYRSREQLIMLVEDDGKGFKPNAKKRSPGIGLLNINSRVDNLKGEVNFSPGTGRGTTVMIKIPLQA